MHAHAHAHNEQSLSKVIYWDRSWEDRQVVHSDTAKTSNLLHDCPWSALTSFMAIARRCSLQFNVFGLLRHAFDLQPLTVTMT